MAFDFPASPTVNQEFSPSGGPTYVWNGTTWTLKATGGGGGASVTIADAPPAAGQGNLWWESDTGALWISYTDSDSTQWVNTNPAGGGNVSSIPTPASGQWAQWTSATTIQGVATASTPWVVKSGDTMTGNLTIVTNPHPRLTFNKAAAGQLNVLTGQTNGLFRWDFYLGNGAAEGGSNTGSDLQIVRGSDAGAAIDTPFAISRANGNVLLGSYTNAQVDISNAQAGIRYASNQWGISLRGMSGATTNYAVAFANAVNTAVGNITTTDTATSYATASDIRLKEDLQPFERGREMIDALPVQDFAWKVGGRGIGLVAQDVADVHPDAVVRGNEEMGDWWSIDYSKYVPLLIQALQDAHKRIDKLEAQLKKRKS